MESDTFLREQTFFNDPVVDRLMGVTMALAAELYVLRERVNQLECGLPGASTADVSAKEDAAAFVERILEPLLGEQKSKGEQ